MKQLEIRILSKTERGYPVQVVVDEKQHLAQGMSPPELLLWQDNATAEEAGRRLFEWLCHDQAVALAWAQLRGQPRGIRLNVQAPELAGLPWEYLRDQAMPLAASVETPFSRYCETKHIVKRARNVATARLLVAIAAPDNVDFYGLAEIDEDKEKQAIEAALADLNIEVRLVPSPVTLAALEHALIQEQPDILHIVAHGNYSPKKRYATLCFANEHNDAAWVSETELTAMLQRQATYLPDFIFLAACESATISDSEVARGLASALMQTAGVPTVMAMQGLVSMQSARAFSQRFYQRLLTHGQVDLACNEARSHLLSLGAWDSYLPLLYSRLPDNQLFWLGGVAQTPATFAERYGVTLAETLDKIQLFGVEQVVKSERDPRRKYPLSVAYITLQVEAEARREADRLARFAKWQAAPSLHRALADHPRLLIQGPAGSGKSTLLKWLAIQLGQGTLSGLLAEWRPYVPFFIRLRRCHDGLPATSGFIGLELPDLACEVPADWVNQILRAGRGVLLIDGLDEVAEARRGKVLDWLDGLARQFPGNRLIVTSRPLWQETAEANPLAEFGYELARLKPMDMADIEAFIEQWHAAVRQPMAQFAAMYAPLLADLPMLQAHLLSQIKAQPALQELAATPLLCAMLCVLNQAQEGQPLPLQRTALYQACLELLLEKRDRAREIPVKLGLDLAQRFIPLRKLAYRWLEEGQLEAEASWVERILGQELAQFGSKVTLDMAEVLRFYAERSGLLQSVGVGLLTFVHKSFQEYLAAQYAHEEAIVAPLVARSHDQNWRQVILLFMSLTTPKLATQFFRQLLAATPSRAQLYLALACVAERPSLDPEIEAQLHITLATKAESLTLLQSFGQTLGLMAKNIPILPPSDEAERDILVNVGHLSAPYLIWKVTYTEYEAAYCVDALGQIGGEVAYQQLKSYAYDRGDRVRWELLIAWDSFDRAQFAREILAVNWAGETYLKYWPVPRLDGLEELPWLTRVILGDFARYSPLTNLAPLRYLVQLQSLKLNDLPQVSDLGVLRELSQLQSLKLNDLPQVSDLGVLRELSQLQSLELRGMPQIKDIGILRELPQLQSLTLWDMPQIKDFSPLLAMPALRRVEFLSMPQAKAWRDSLPSDVGFEVVIIEQGRRV